MILSVINRHRCHVKLVDVAVEFGARWTFAYCYQDIHLGSKLKKSIETHTTNFYFQYKQGN